MSKKKTTKKAPGLTIKELATKEGVSERTVRNWIHLGKVNAKAVDNKWRILMSNFKRPEQRPGPTPSKETGKYSNQSLPKPSAKPKTAKKKAAKKKTAKRVK